VAPAGVQDAWNATFSGDNGNTDHSNWQDNADTDWTTSKGVKVPGGVGTYTVQVSDNVVRVEATNAPSIASATRQFTVALTSGGTAVDTLNGAFEDPVIELTGTRAAGIPDQIGLFRDNVQVPLWDPVDGIAYMWAPAVNFFSGQNFTLRDYTVDLRHQHTWKIRTKVGGVTGNGGPTFTGQFHTDGVWLVDPRTGKQIQIFGDNAVPTVEQATDEGSILHTPVHGNLIVEPIRRRLMRTTRYGTVTGKVDEGDEDILDSWVMGDSGLKYRLIFGKINWSVIIGNYSPSDVFYPGNLGPDRVLVVFNWWERLADY